MSNGELVDMMGTPGEEGYSAWFLCYEPNEEPMICEETTVNGEVVQDYIGAMTLRCVLENDCLTDIGFSPSEQEFRVETAWQAIRMLNGST